MPRQLPRLLGAVVVLTASAALVACSSSDDDAPASAPTPPPTLSCDDVTPPPSPEPDGELVLGVQVDPLTAVCAQAAAVAGIRERTGAYPADLAAATASPTEGLFPAPQGYTHDPATDTFTVCVGDEAGSATYDSAVDAVTLAATPC
ncbi:hypothetical protein [Nocardioides sp.]|uniref:hypothetical protein n=1 Tax=Nocardioides sp. TaxID=35761 RepID=UPI0035136962